MKIGNIDEIQRKERRKLSEDTSLKRREEERIREIALQKEREDSYFDTALVFFGKKSIQTEGLVGGGQREVLPIRRVSWSELGGDKSKRSGQIEFEGNKYFYKTL